MDMEVSNGRIKMPYFQIGILGILLIMSIYAVFRAETFISKVHKFMSTMERSMAQMDRAMVQMDHALAMTQAVADKVAPSAAAIDMGADRGKVVRVRPKQISHAKIEASAQSSDQKAKATP